MTRAHGNSLRTYLLTRIALALPTVLILLTVVFLLMRVAPGDPIQAALGGQSRQEEIEKRKEDAPATTADPRPSTWNTSARCVDPQPRRRR